MDVYRFPSDPETTIASFTLYHNEVRYHESLDSLTTVVIWHL